MKDRLHTGLQRHRGRCLRHPVGDRGHAEYSRAPRRLGYLHRHHRRRKVGPRRHPVPNLVKVVPQIGLELGQGLPVHPGGTLVGPYTPVRLPHQLLRYLKRFAFRT